MAQKAHFTARAKWQFLFSVRENFFKLLFLFFVRDIFFMVRKIFSLLNFCKDRESGLRISFSGLYIYIY